MESIDQIRQMMAEQKFLEAQRLIEAQFALNVLPRQELLRPYAEVLAALNKEISDPLCLELAEIELQSHDTDRALELVRRIRGSAYYTRVAEIRARVAEGKGLVDDLYTQLSEFLIRQFFERVPVVPVWHDEMRMKYFKSDFTLRLKLLALQLLRQDLTEAEASIRELLRSIYECSSHRNVHEKLTALAEVLIVAPGKSPLDVYRSFCLISSKGLQEVADYKRLIELVVTFDTFPLQAMVLNLFDELGIHDAASAYAPAVRVTPGYNFVYFDKYFPRLKHYFVDVSAAASVGGVHIHPAPDLELLEKSNVDPFPEHELIDESSELEQRFSTLLKYQTYTDDQLCDLAVSFLQLEFPRVALEASLQARNRAPDDRAYLKASYLVLTCHLQLRDYRAALDTGFDALSKATSRDDVLSFMYGQSEAYLRLRRYADARAVLRRIVAIDADYRLARSRLEKLNEI